MKYNKTFLLLMLVVLSSVVTAETGAIWAKSVTSGSGESRFNAVTTDTSGNIYAVGYIFGTGTYNFGNGVTVARTYSGSNSLNTLLVKYDSTGNAHGQRVLQLDRMNLYFIQ